MGMLKKSTVLLILVFSVYMAGCASVPMASDKEDAARKEFSAPPQDSAGLYIYRNTSLGGVLKKNVYIDGEFIGETAPMTYFYKVITPGIHVVSTESEFSDNSLEISVESGNNYFVRQYMKLGLFVGGANLELVSDEEGKEGVLECELAN
jgi:hypothetical protein